MARKQKQYVGFNEMTGLKWVVWLVSLLLMWGLLYVGWKVILFIVGLFLVSASINAVQQKRRF